MPLFQQSYHVPGTLCVPLEIAAALPVDCTLLEVSAVCAGAPGCLTVGTRADPQACLPAASTGAQGQPRRFTRADFRGGQYPRLARGETLVAALVPLSGGKAGKDAASQAELPASFTLVLTFLEG
jgi:hypothetical protein